MEPEVRQHRHQGGFGGAAHNKLLSGAKQERERSERLRRVATGIKLSNVLIDDNFHARICDFGLSTLLLEECEGSLSAQSNYASHLGGSVRWADAYLFRSFEDDIAPPLIGTWNDIYSFGSIILEVLSGRMPYHYLRTDAQVVMQLHQGIRPRRPASVCVDDDQWKLIQSCWQETLQKRPSANEVLKAAQNLLALRTQRP
ncbi:hypothetical protein D9619_013145 [Psilocybe cf. subviscida]|uniref:Protein kinase domain-containing protein n=1 Tax=Psilocybe cf. subviscida TaxID=2480587 RepID=A0A8H5EZ09_9AGAR|nr:hypothetical protein D9619_013145 [Psilocybe cf. subviscida]